MKQTARLLLPMAKSHSFCRSLFHLRESQTQAPVVNLSETEFPSVVHVSYYHASLQSAAYSNTTNTHKVVELARFKTTTRSGYKKQRHQKVVAKVETGQRGIYGYVCFERARQTRLSYNTLGNLVGNSSPSIRFEKLLDSLIEDGMPMREASTILHLKQESLHPVHGNMDENSESGGDSSTNASTRNAYSEGSSESSASVSTQWSELLVSNADDTVCRLSEYPSGMGVKRLECLKPRNLRLWDLAILVAAVHDLNAVYSIFHDQRLWFANLIMRTVEKDHEMVDEQVPAFGGIRLKVGGSKDEVCSGAGRWYKVRIDKTLLVIVGMVRIQYYERRRKFDKRVSQELIYDVELMNFCLFRLKVYGGEMNVRR